MTNQFVFVRSMLSGHPEPGVHVVPLCVRVHVLLPLSYLNDRVGYVWGESFIS